MEVICELKKTPVDTSVLIDAEGNVKELARTIFPTHALLVAQVDFLPPSFMSTFISIPPKLLPEQQQKLNITFDYVLRQGLKTKFDGLSAAVDLKFLTYVGKQSNAAHGLPNFIKYCWTDVRESNVKLNNKFERIYSSSRATHSPGVISLLNLLKPEGVLFYKVTSKDDVSTEVQRHLKNNGFKFVFMETKNVYVMQKSTSVPFTLKLYNLLIKLKNKLVTVKEVPYVDKQDLERVSSVPVSTWSVGILFYKVLGLLQTVGTSVVVPLMRTILKTVLRCYIYYTLWPVELLTAVEKVVLAGLVKLMPQLSTLRNLLVSPSDWVLNKDAVLLNWQKLMLPMFMLASISLGVFLSNALLSWLGADLLGRFVSWIGSMLSSLSPGVTSYVLECLKLPASMSGAVSSILSSKLVVGAASVFRLASLFSTVEDLDPCIKLDASQSFYYINTELQLDYYSAAQRHNDNTRVCFQANYFESPSDADRMLFDVKQYKYTVFLSDGRCFCRANEQVPLLLALTMLHRKRKWPVASSRVPRLQKEEMVWSNPQYYKWLAAHFQAAICVLNEGTKELQFTPRPGSVSSSLVKRSGGTGLSNVNPTLFLYKHGPDLYSPAINLGIVYVQSRSV